MLALKCHPDRNKDPGAEATFKEIAAAYAVLSDPEKRTQYDTQGFAGVAGFSEEDLFRHVDFGDLFGGFNFDFGGLGFGAGGGLFDRFFRRRRAGPPRGENIDVELEVPLARVMTGGEERVQVTRAVGCPACRGTGAKDGTKRHRCETCQGRGSVVEQSQRRETGGDVIVRTIRACAACEGRGEIVDERCPACDGRGRTTRTETLTVNVPVGVEEGMALRVPGHGMPSEARGGKAGDLYVIVRTLADPRFVRRGADLWRAEAVTIPEAVLGGRHIVPTVDGSADVTIPPGTQPGSLLRLAEKGLPEFGGGRRGHLYLQLHVEIPERLSKKQRELYEQLRAFDGAKKRT